MALEFFSTSPLPSVYQPHSKPADRVDEYYLDSEDIVEPIAVVGLSLKFPDDATTPEAFWKLLLEKAMCFMRDARKPGKYGCFCHSDGSRPILYVINDLLWVTGDVSSSTSTPELEVVTGLVHSLR
jgi:hypothetical protein